MPRKENRKIMKEVVTIIILILLIISSNVFVEKYLLETSNDIINDLEIFREKLDSSENVDLIFEDLDNIQAKWGKIVNKWAIIVEHQEIDKIELCILQIEEFMKEDEMGDVLANISQAEFLLKHIPEIQKVKIKNVF